MITGVGAIPRHPLALAHTVADDLAAAEFDFLAVDGEVLFDFDHELGVGKAHPIARRGAEHLGVSAAADLHGFVPGARGLAGDCAPGSPSRAPITAPLKP